MDTLSASLLDSLPSYGQDQDTQYLAALDQIIHAQPTSIRPEQRQLLLEWLLEGLAQAAWNERVVLKAVQAVKALGRNPIGTDVLATRKALETLVHLAALPSLSSNAPSSSTSFGSPISDEALRVLSNVLLLHSSARKTLVELDVGPRLVGAQRRLTKGDAEDRWAGRGDLIFLGSRLGFLMSVEGGEGVLKLVDAGVVDLLADILSSPPTPTSALDPLPEVLKLAYNILSFYPRLSSQRVRLTDEGRVWEGVEEDREGGGVGEWWDPALDVLLPTLLERLLGLPTPSSLPLPSATQQLLACLLPFPITSFDLVPEHAQTFVQVWDVCTRSFEVGARREDELVERDLPVLALLLARLLGLEEARKVVTPLFFPEDMDRSTDSEPLQNRVGNLGRAIRLMTSPPEMAQTRVAVGELLFALAERDPNKMCDLVGYGNSAGFLLTKGFSAPSSSSSAADPSNPSQLPSTTPPVLPPSSPPATRPSSSSESSIDPMTALRASGGPTHDPTMTDADKEREAERLFVLFDRIKKNPAISLGSGAEGGATVDPVREAVESGRFQEMDESTEAEKKRLDDEDAQDERDALDEVAQLRARRGQVSRETGSQ